jgi:transposase
MVRRRRPIYSPEFRAEAVRRVRNSDESLLTIARDLGVSTGSLKTWVEASRPKPDVPLTDDERTELRRLRKENRELKMEREILKKATAFFAKHSE